MTGYSDLTSRARAALLDRFAWNGGHADVWRVLSRGPSLLVDQLHDGTRAELGTVTSLVLAGELGDPESA